MQGGFIRELGFNPAAAYGTIALSQYINDRVVAEGNPNYAIGDKRCDSSDGLERRCGG
jgi:hypothetical protein